MPDFNAREWACMIPLVIMMVWMGIYTQTFLPAITEANLKILDQSKSNAPLRVSLPGYRAGSAGAAAGGNAHAR
jgi:NADH-quinone oxidoreductase subunit M